MEDVLARLARGGTAEEHEFGVVGMVGKHWMHLELAETTSEIDMRIGRDVLIAEHEHLVTHERFTQRGNGAVVEHVVEVDRGHLGTDDRRDRGEVEQSVGRADGGLVGGEGGGHGSPERVEGLVPSSVCDERCVQCISNIVFMHIWHDAPMDLRRLRHLISVAEHGNFGRAAAASYITQPALSRSIQALEAEVGAPLFDRLPTGVEPTDMGRLLLRHAKALDTGARDLDREIRLAKGMELGELRIGVGPWGGAALVAPVIGRLHAQHPRLRLQVVVAPWRELPPRLTDRDVDIVVGALGEIEPLDAFAVDAVSDHDVVVVGRGGHPLTGTVAATVDDIVAYPLVGPATDYEAADPLVALLISTTAHRAQSPTAAEVFAIECDSSDVLKRLLVETDALTFMPRFLVEDELRDGRLAIVAALDLGLRVRFGAAWVRGRTLGDAGTTFIDLLRAHDHEGQTR